ncbi:MAG: energy-coupling factor ABC transporter ATP-binding protein [Methanosarcinales archaeon]
MSAIKTIDLSYIYPDGTPALNGIDFTAKRRERVAILGQNGSGKTTLFYHFNGLYFPTKGKVLVNGEKITKKNIDEVRRTVGLVFQDPDTQLFAPTVWNDIAYGPRNLGFSQNEIEQIVEEVLAILDIKSLKHKNPENLSTGQKKLVAIAGVLAMDPEILVMDEPTSGLDPKGSADIIEILDELHSEGKTIIISTHNVDLASSWADRIYVLHSGRICFQGEPRQIFENRSLIKKTQLKDPIIVQTWREFSARGISDRENGVPLSILDLVDSIKLSEKLKTTKLGQISVIRIPKMIEGGPDAVDLPLLLKYLQKVNPDRIGAMGTSAKMVAKKANINCDYEEDVIQSSILAALNGLNTLILATGGMADRVVQKVTLNNLKNKRMVKCEIPNLTSP